MDCFCEMECEYTPARRITVSISQTLLEEKHTRAAEFGRYLEQHPDTDTILGAELMRATSIYRIALANLITDKTRESEKVNLKSVPAAL